VDISGAFNHGPDQPPAHPETAFYVHKSSQFCAPLHQVKGDWQHAVGPSDDHPNMLRYPRGVALSPDEEFLLVADRGGSRRVVVLRATDGMWLRQLTGPPGTLYHVYSVAVVPSTGEVLVLDCYLHQMICFRSIADDSVVGILGSAQGSGLTEFDHPENLVVLDGPHCPPV
jgi:hypothetical protein